jgi:uncharacterized protein (TIGR02722 family)
MMKSLFAVTALLSILFLSGCAHSGARYIDPQGTETIVSLNQINIQDWQNAADQLVQSLLTSGAVERAPRQPAVLAISRIINNTSQHVDTDSLIKKIRVALSRTGKVATTTTMGLGGRAEDPLAKETAEYTAFMNDTPAAAATPMPDFTLTAKLLEDRAKAGRTRQTTYSFQMSLTEVASGLAVWEDEVQITKSGRKPSVGW